MDGYGRRWILTVTASLRADDSNLVTDSYTSLCTIRADTSKLADSMQSQQLPGGGVYYSIDFCVVLLFGLTELKAQISWTENVRWSLFWSKDVLTSFSREEKLGKPLKLTKLTVLF